MCVGISDFLENKENEVIKTVSACVIPKYLLYLE